MRCYATLLPRLSAERSLAHVAEVQAADSWQDADERRRLVRAWQAQAWPLEERRKPTKDEFFAAMADLGFRVM